MKYMQSTVVNSDSTNLLIGKTYANMYSRLLYYITAKIGCKYDAEDLLQDTFVKLIHHAPMLRPETITSFVFTIARNLAVDYLRRLYKKEECSANTFDFCEKSSNYTESSVIATDLVHFELKKLESFPSNRKKVYELHRFNCLSVEEITEELNMSKKQVENYLFTGRKVMRDYFKNCI